MVVATITGVMTAIMVAAIAEVTAAETAPPAAEPVVSASIRVRSWPAESPRPPAEATGGRR